ncbi:MAG: S41 family peptidase [Bacteroidota bacterium]
MIKKSILIIISLMLGFSSLSAQSLYEKDFEYFIKTLEENYAYFEGRGTNWERVKEIYTPRVEKIKDLSNFIRLIEEIWNELYNGHMSINFNLPSSSRLIPQGADFWVEYREGEFVIVDLRVGFNAEEVGLKPGMKVTHFNGQSVILALQKYLPKSFTDYDARAYEHAANVLLAGTHDQDRKITAVWEGKSKDYFPDITPNRTANFQMPGLLSTEKMEGNIGYIRIHNSLGNPELIKEFDKALDGMMDTHGLIIDLRETSSGGNTVVARGLMGRFISEEKPYQRHRFPYEEKYFGIKRSTMEYVSPRGNLYDKPLVVLVSHWTASMGEGITIAFDAMDRAKIVGTRMAGLLGAIDCYQMEETSMQFCFPTEQLFHVDGTPREDFVPEYLMKESKDALSKALDLLKK